MCRFLIVPEVFVVMEFVGPSLQSRLSPLRRFSEAEARAAMRQLLRGAEALHGAGIIHRDLKPDNVLVGAGCALKICDLGMAMPARPPGVLYPEETVAALWYRAPELLAGSRAYGPAVDVWALGCVMGELLMGAPVFEAEDTAEGILARARGLRDEMETMEEDERTAFAEEVAELSEAGREVLCGLLRFEPEKRLTAAEALRHRWFQEEDADLSDALSFEPGSPSRTFIRLQ